MALATANFYIVIGQAPPPACTEGTVKCEGNDQYICINGQWVLKEVNSPVCVTQPSEIPTWIYYAAGGAAAFALLALIASQSDTVSKVGSKIRSKIKS